MKTEDLLFTMVFIIGFICMIIFYIRERMRYNKRFYNRVLKCWGKVPDREYTYEELSSISKYARSHKDESFFIDDITWNDLDMDSIFMLLNNTVSSCGEDQLYAMLRIPAFEQATLDERNRLIEFFQKKEAERMKVQKTLASIGKTPGLSLGEYVYRLKEIPRQSSLLYILLDVALFVGIGLFFVQPLIGILIVFGLLLYKMNLYIHERGAIEPYLRCFQCILCMMGATSQLTKLGIPEISEYCTQLEQASRKLNSFRRGSVFVTSKGDVSGDVASGILQYFNIIFHMDRIKFNSMLKELDGHQEDVEVLMKNLGLLDATIGVASFREYLPYYSRGEFEKQNPLTMEVHDLYHPLLESPVANSMTATKGTLVTGSNASGKSTFLKTVAINAILAQTIDTAVATSYRNGFVKVMTSMALSDNLNDGESYYIVEIKSLKRILDEIELGQPVLCVIDEVLRGTNTIERIAASSQILKYLCRDHVLSFAATHDLELSYILETLYENYHFDETFEDGDIHFNYQLKTGRTNTRNAIGLLEIMGYQKEIVDQARQEAAEFEKAGEWKLC